VRDGFRPCGIGHVDGCIPAWTAVGVESLARPDLMIEIEATAASD